MTTPTSLRLALDWTPNPVHAGILLAQLNGWYTQAALAVELLSPEADNYQKYPIQRLLDGEVQLAMAPSEHVLEANAGADALKVVAVASVFYQDNSCWVTKTESGLTRPSMLAGKTAACYGTYFEQEILHSLIAADGGPGQPNPVLPGKLSVWDTFATGGADTCWVFKAWEVALAHTSGMAVQQFRLADYGIPYGPSPVIIARAEDAAQWPAWLDAFVENTARGYQQAAALPEACAESLHKHLPHPNLQFLEVLTEGMRLCAPDYLNPAGAWGQLDQERWQAWAEWLAMKGLYPADQLHLAMQGARF